MFLEKLPKEDGLEKYIKSLEEKYVTHSRVITVGLSPALMYSVKEQDHYWIKAFEEHFEAKDKVLEQSYMDDNKTHFMMIRGNKYVCGVTVDFPNNGLIFEVPNLPDNRRYNKRNKQYREIVDSFIDRIKK